MNGKPWEEEEIDFLKDNYGIKSEKYICKALGRTPSAIENKITRLELGRWYYLGDYCTLSEMVSATGITYSTFRNWVENYEFPIIKKRYRKTHFRMVDLDKFWKWAEKNKNMVEWDKIPYLVFGEEPEWVDEARKAKVLERDRSLKKTPWTKSEDEKLIWLLKKQQYTYSDIAKELGRTHGAIKKRLNDLNIKLRPVYRDNHKKYSKEEVTYILEKYQSGYSFKTIAEELNRSEAGVRGKVERLGYSFRNRVLVKEN